MPRADVTSDEVLSFTGEEAFAAPTPREPIPKNSYLVQIEAKPSTTRAGKPTVDLNLTVVDDKDGGTYKNRHVFDSIYLIGADEDKTMNLQRRVQLFYEAATGEKLTGDASASEVSVALSRSLNGKRIVVDVEIEEAINDDDDKVVRNARNRVAYRGAHSAETWVPSF